MVIEYEKYKFTKENGKIEIDDTKNIFLKGTNPFDNLDTYFGIWPNNGGLSIVTIISYRTITYKHYLNTNLSTICDIQEYLKNNDNVKIIQKDQFEEQINHIRSIFEIGKDEKYV